MTTAPHHLEGYDPGTVGYAGLVAGLGLAAVSMAAGYVWALEGHVLRVYLAGTASWIGYLLAHYAVTGVPVDPIGEGAPSVTDPTADKGEKVAVGDLRSALPADARTAAGFLLGVIIIVVGVAMLAVFVAERNVPLAAVGAGLFLFGYAIAHQIEAGVPL